MNFEEVLKKIKEGTATPEERAMFEQRTAEANSLLSGKKPLDFDEALAHVEDGSATDEEREYVKAQLDEANSLLRFGAREDGLGKEVKTPAPSDDDVEKEMPGYVEAELEPEDDLRSGIDFEDALDHVQQGTATEQEKLYVKSQMAAAHAFFADDSRRSSAPVKEASGEDVKRAKKSFKMHYVIIPVCVLLVIVIAVGAILGGVFGYAASSAKKNMKFSEAQCRTRAIDYVFANQADYGVPADTFSVGQLRVDEIDRQFCYNDRNLAASYYSYEIEIEAQTVLQGTGRPVRVELEVKLRINTATGNIDVIRYDID